MKIGINVKLGIIAGVINCAAWYAFAKSLGYYSLNIEQYRYYVTLILLLLGIFISIYFERKNNKGCIDFKNAVKCGILYTLVIALILAIFNYLYYKFIAVDAIDFFVADVRKKMEADKLKEENIVSTVEVVRSYFGQFRIFMSTVIMGVIISLISGAFLRRKNSTPPFSEN